MPRMNIERSIAINATKEKVFAKLNNFNEWTPWSPWLIMDPDAKVTIAEDAKSYEWEGGRVGSGNMKIMKENGLDFIEYDLNFLKPWKSHATTGFKLEELNDAVQVTWYMNSKLPLLMFWMKNMMESFVAADYERGLYMLKAYAETDTIPSKLEFIGNENKESFKYVGIKTTCPIETIGKSMENDFSKLRSEFPDAKSGSMSIYHKWDIVKGIVSYTAAYTFDKIPDNYSSELITGEIPSTKTYTLRHTGSYQHIGNAWSTLYSMQRNKEIRVNKAIDPYEIYLNDPSDTLEKDLKTDIHFPLK